MGVVIPQVVTSDRATGAQVIDGSLKFDSGKNQFLRQTFSADGNKKTFTYSFWAKKTLQSQDGGIIFSGDNNVDGNNFEFRDAADKLRVYSYQNNSAVDYRTSAEYRDTNGWKHFVVSIDSTNSTASDRMKLYVNGERVTSFSTSTGTWGDNIDYKVNTSGENHYIGLLLNSSGAQSTWFDGQMSQFYFIDGQALGPEYFGYTDGLTNTWKPKKYTGGFSYTLTAPTYDSGGGSDVTTSEFDKMVDGDLSTYGQGTGASGTNRFIGFSLAATKYPRINIKIKNTTGGALDFYIQPDTGSGYDNAGTFASSGSNSVNVAGGVTHEDTFTFPSNYSGTGRIYLNNSGNAADAWEIYDFGGTKVTTNSFHLPFDGNSPIGQDQSGNGNDWTPVNFGGSNTIEKATGVFPILNTTQGGTQAGVGVFGSKQNVGYAVTVYDDGGGNKYYIDGVKQDTVTGLIRGATYTFDTSDSTVSSHPFRFSATSNGSHGGGSEYTNGVAAITGAATTITVPHDAPNTLYYYCTSHSGMGADITGITTNEKLADQYASHCVLAVPFINGDATDISPSIACTATAHTLTKQGDPTSSSTSYNFYSSSTDFDGTGDYYKSASSSDFAFGTGDFTIEYWIDSDDLAGNQYGHLQISSSSTGLQENYTAGLAIYESPNVGAIAVPGLTGISIPSTGRLIKAGVWNHIALVREGTNARIYINGFLADSSTDSKDVTGTYLGIGGYYNTSYLYNGRLQDLRIYKGVAKYNDSFEVPVTSPAILPDTPSGVSGSSKLTKITDGAVAFDGSGDYLSLANSTDLDQEGDFTQECFYYQNGDGQGNTDVIFVKNVTNYGYIGVNFGGTNQIKFFQHNIAALITGPVLASKRWYHLAATRSGSTVRLFVDGVLVGSTTYSTDTTGNAVSYIGGFPSAHSLNGFISDLRVIKGTALYTSNFTPPSAPLTDVTNTKLLCCQSNSSATEAAVTPGSITANGDAAATNFNPFITDIHAVRGQESGYTTWNPLDIQGLDSGDLKDGNLSITHPAGNWLAVRANKFVSSGKWYYEVKVGNNQYTTFGVGSVDYNLVPTSNDWCNVANVYGFYPYDGTVYDAGSARSYATADTSAAGNVYGIAIDMDNKTLRFYENGIDLGVAFDSTTATNFVNKESVAPMAWLYNQSGTDEYNFGQKPFKYAPPDGFQPLNAANTRPDNVILRPDQYVGIVTYASDGNARTISGLNFQPDLVWQKQTTSGDSDRHFLTDSVRGAGTALRSDTTAADASSDAVASFTSDGWTIGSGSGNANQNTKSYVAWAWKAGGNKNTFNVDDVGYATAAAAGITGLDGTNQMTTAKYLGCSIGTKQGFSIIKYNGLGGSNDVAIPHGLSQSPDLVIVKNLTDDISWAVAHSGFVDNRELHLDTDESSTSVAFLGLYKSNFTSTSFAVNYGASNLNYVNASGKDYIAYVWHNVDGLQKFGFYKGNQNADGVYVELGFRPKLVWIKAVSVGGSGYSWYIHDSERSKFNPTKLDLKADSNANNVTTTRFDFLSSGFKIRGANLDMNDSGERFIYCAWAEAPTVDLFGGGANAR